MPSLARRLDPRSALVGLGLTGSLVLLTSIAVPTAPMKSMRINIDPEASSIVRIDEGGSYKVPDKVRLVLKAVGAGSQVSVSINGAVLFDTGITDHPPIQLFPFPLVAEPGDVVAVEEGFPDPDRLSFVTGYLSE